MLLVTVDGVLIGSRVAVLLCDGVSCASDCDIVNATERLDVEPVHATTHLSCRVVVRDPRRQIHHCLAAVLEPAFASFVELLDKGVAVAVLIDKLCGIFEGPFDVNAMTDSCEAEFREC